HPQIRCVWTGVNPRPLAKRPTEPRRSVGLPALHFDNTILDIKLQRLGEPPTKLTERQSVTHRQRPGAHKALPSRSQHQTFDRPTDRIRSIKYPHRFLMFRSRFEDVAECRGECIDPAPQILQVDEDDIAGIHHRSCRRAYLAIQAKYRDIVYRIVEFRRLDHVVLLVAT